MESNKVFEARQEEVKGLKGRHIYTNAPVQEYCDNTGKRPIRTPFVDLNKGDNLNPNYRPRPVATEVEAGSLL